MYLSDIKSNQRRDCFRLQCSLPISAERPRADSDERPKPFQGKMLNLSDGGLAFVTNEAVNVGEILTLTF
ncbi:MAG: PilZ domain-containing protein, partial [Defluviitaleaceae bacterium]|nr:PilZ domain-containing protein [Defluviitaleaceae bacterium]